jgi:hypothetical protein
MSFKAETFRVLIASPGDLEEERQVATDAINEWNASHSRAESVVLLPVKWETHSVPETGVRAQRALNEQFVKDCDILVGMFWTRLGTHTGVAESGTIEEIDQFTSAGKPAMLYFSRRPIDPTKIDLRQNKKLREFKSATQKKAITESFSSTDELRALLGRHLVAQVRKLKSGMPSEAVDPARAPVEKFSERKVIVRVPADAPNEPLRDLPADTTIEFVGGSFGIFNIDTRLRTSTWASLIKQSHNDTSLAWIDTIKSVIAMAQQYDFAQNRRLLPSLDGNRFFGLHLSRSLEDFNGITEFHISIVEVKSKDYGDPTTAMLLKAVSVGLMYRSMFLEGSSSEFSPEAIQLTFPDALPKAVRELLQELDYVEWMSTDAGLREPQNLSLIYPSWNRGELERMLLQWERLKSDLTGSALKVLDAKREELKAARSEFEDRLAAFCSATIPINKESLTKVMRLLESRLGIQE